MRPQRGYTINGVVVTDATARDRMLKAAEVLARSSVPLHRDAATFVRRNWQAVSPRKFTQLCEMEQEAQREAARENTCPTDVRNALNAAHRAGRI